MFYDNFLALCSKKNVKPTRAAVESGVARSAVSNWKSNWQNNLEVLPNNSNTKSLAKYFNVSIDELLGDEKKPTTQESSELSEIEKLIQDAKNRKASETMILKYSGGKPEAVILSDEEMKIIDVLIVNAKNRQK